MNFRRLFQRLIASRFASRSLLFLLLAALFAGGLQLRWLTWEKTTHLRFQHDIVNGFYWGSRTLQGGRRLSPAEEGNSWPGFLRGYFALYDRVKREAHGSDYRLDYPPLRLLVMSIWAKEVQEQFPGAEDGKPEYVEPLLRLNLFCEVVSARSSSGLFPSTPRQLSAK